MSIVAILLEELSFRRYGGPADRAWLLLWALVENLGYRQLTVLWRLRGIVGFLRGDAKWGAMERQRFVTDEPSETDSVAA